MLLYKTRRDWLGEIPGLVEDGAYILERAGASAGQVFLLGPDGSYDLALNRFLRELSSWGVRSENGAEAYARDLGLFCRFLYERRGGKSLWQVNQEDLQAYRRVRRRVEGPHQISAATWNRFIAALDKWVAWSLDARLLVAEPFRYVEKTVVTSAGVVRMRVNAEREPDESPEHVDFLAYEDYLLWRDVGLRGLLPDGHPDPAWRGRHGVRNGLFADLLIGTGLRLREASSLLVPELPSPVLRGRIGPIRVARAVAKRGRARTVYGSKRLLTGLHHYVAVERDELVQRRRHRGAYRRADDLVTVRSTGRHGLVLVGAGAAVPTPASAGRSVCGWCPWMVADR
ncbi:site-specific integrase [Streptomyces sp. NPDC001118]